MAQDPPSDGKGKRLRRQSNLNPRAEKVSDPLFEQDAFFDPRDLMQVKYEMLRRVRVDDQPISKAAANFGFSRPAFYAIQQAFKRCGLSGLLPKKRGPQRRHKLTDEIVEYLNDTIAKEGRLKAPLLVERVQKRFGVKLHPRSIERGLDGAKKKRLKKR